MATKKRLIDANETINAFTNWLTSRYDGRLPRDIVAEIPTVDAKEVVHGRWLKGYPIHCSVCGGAAPTEYEDCNRYEAWLTPYCPNCGAKMDGDENGT